MQHLTQFPGGSESLFPLWQFESQHFVHLRKTLSLEILFNHQSHLHNIRRGFSNSSVGVHIRDLHNVTTYGIAFPGDL